MLSISFSDELMLFTTHAYGFCTQTRSFTSIQMACMHHTALEPSVPLPVRVKRRMCEVPARASDIEAKASCMSQDNNQQLVTAELANIHVIWPWYNHPQLQCTSS
jgi:predicted nucleic acid-binding Zn ribbon protein